MVVHSQYCCGIFWGHPLRVLLLVVVSFLTACATSSPPQSQEEILRKAEAQIATKRQEQLAANRAETDRRNHLILLEEARGGSIVVCENKAACDKAYALTKLFIRQNSETKIQLIDETLIESFNPMDEGQIAINAMKAPGVGDRSTIQIQVNCRDSIRVNSVLCLIKKRATYLNYRAFMDNAIK